MSRTTRSTRTTGTTRRHRRLTGLVLLPAASAIALAACAPVGATERVSVSSGGLQANGASTSQVVTPDGRSVAFASTATNLAGGTAGVANIFVKDRQTGSVARVSTAFGGGASNGSSTEPAISADASRVAFSSVATNLRGLTDENGTVQDVFVHLRQNPLTLLASVGADGGPANGASKGPDLSADGQVVVFESRATNLVSGDTNGQSDVFLHDVGTGATRRVSVSQSGGQNPASSTRPAVDADGSRVVFVTTANLSPTDQDSTADVYLRDVAAGTTSLVSIDAPGADTAVQADISDDGRFVAFVSSNGSSTFQTWVRDVQSGQLTLISHAASSQAPSNGDSNRVSIASDGSHVAFSSAATDLVTGDTNAAFDHFVAKVDGTGVERVSVAADGAQSSGASTRPAVANTGREVFFESPATNLVADDTNGAVDVFVRKRS